MTGEKSAIRKQQPTEGIGLQRTFTQDAKSELESLLHLDSAQDFIRCLGRGTDSLREVVGRVAQQDADERGGTVTKRDILDAWERVTQWGDVTLWKNELRRMMDSV